MNPPFFLTGYPRSRTAWLANFFTTGPVFCHHDGLRGCKDLDALDRKLRMNGRTHVGDSDSALLLFHVELRARYPDAKWVLIERNSHDAIADFNRAFPGVLNVTETLAAFAELEKGMVEVRKFAVRVGFDALNSEDVARRLWDHVLPSVPFDAARWRMLDGLTVQPMAEKMRYEEARKELMKA